MSNGFYDAVVLLGFGGPRNSDEVRPFLERVLAGKRIPPQRFDAVAKHYADIGGASPFNAITSRQAAGLSRALLERDLPIPVYVAYRFSRPSLADAAFDLQAARVRRVLAIVLAVHRGAASTQRYVDAFTEACRAADVAFDVDYAPAFFDHPLFIRAQAACVRASLRRLRRTNFQKTALIFTAHSIPRSIADDCTYVSDLMTSARLVAMECGASSWTVAYQSRSGNPSEPWLEPDVRDVLRSLPKAGIGEAIVAPIGFLCDHVEVLYDLDIDAARVAADAGIRMERAAAVNDAPHFIAMLATLVERAERGMPAAVLAP